MKGAKCQLLRSYKYHSTAQFEFTLLGGFKVKNKTFDVGSKSVLFRSRFTLANRAKNRGVGVVRYNVNVQGHC